MKLYVYEHCPFCARARMIFGLKKIPLDLHFLLEDDVDTPNRLVGKKTAPILEKENGSHMAESMDIVHYLDQRAGGQPLASASPNSAIQSWCEAAWSPTLKLSIPRLAKGDFPEFATPEAREAFRLRQRKHFGDLDALMVNTAVLVAEINERLEKLDALLADRAHIDAHDFQLYPQLRMLSIAQAVRFPVHVERYLEHMEHATGLALHRDQAF